MLKHTLFILFFTLTSQGCTHVSRDSTSGLTLVSSEQGFTNVPLTNNKYRINYSGSPTVGDMQALDSLIAYAAEIAEQQGFDAIVVLEVDKTLDDTIAAEQPAIAFNREVPKDLQCSMSGCDEVASAPAASSDQFYAIDDTREPIVHLTSVVQFGYARNLAQSNTEFVLTADVLADTLPGFDTAASN